MRIARLVLEAAGVDAERVDDGLAAWCARIRGALPRAPRARRHERLARRAGRGGGARAPRGRRPPPRAPDREPGADGQGAHERLGLARFFRPGQGAFGCDSRVARRADRRSRASPRRRLAGRTRPSRSATPPATSSSAREAGIQLAARRPGHRSRRRPGATRLAGTQGYTPPMAQAPALPTGFELPLEPQAAADRLDRPGRAGGARRPRLRSAASRREAKVFALDLAVRMTDLTTLEGADTPGKVAALASKAIRPDPSDASVPSVAALCVYPNLVPTAVERLARQRRQGRLGRDRLPVGPVAARGKARRGALGGRARRRRGRHGDRPRRLPGRPLREGLRRDRRA